MGMGLYGDVVSLELNGFQWMKYHNRRKVLELLERQGEITRGELAKSLNLTKQTITNIVHELIHKKLVVEERKLETDGAGKRPTLLRLHRENLYSAGVEVNKSYIRGVLINLQGTVIHVEDIHIQSTVDTGPIGDFMLRAVFQMIENLLAHIPPSGQRLGLGIGVQGLVDGQNGVISYSPFLDWYQLPLAEILKERFALPTFVDNNVRAFARGELWKRSHRTLNDALCVYVDEGVGCAVLVGGQLYTGSNFRSGEFGHVKVQMNGEQCLCGDKGCLEAYISIPQILSKLGLRGRSFDDVVHLGETGDSECLALMGLVGTYLGMTIGNVVNVLDPQTVIIGGELVAAKTWFHPSMIETLHNTFIGNPEDLEILYSEFHAYHCSIGAAAMVFHPAIAVDF